MKEFIKKIERINFGLMSPEDIRSMSVVRVETPDTYDSDGYPIENGLMDPRLGVLDPSLKCHTCGVRGGDCQGHFGSIELARPVLHVGFGDIIHKILRSTCNECGRVLLNPEEIFYYHEKIEEALENKKNISKILNDVYTKSKRDMKEKPAEDEEIDEKYCCPHCGTPQLPVTLDKPTSIFQDDYKLTASEIRKRLERITDDDMYILGINPEVARPEWLVLTVLPVPPVTVRPSITLDTGERSEDDLTHKLVDILRINQRLVENMEAGAPQLIVEDLWDLLQYHVTTYFDNEADGTPPSKHRSGRPLKTLTQRLKGKEGRFRSNLSGKRVNFSARTVITPDPNISINEVGVPEMIAKEVTVPAYVNDWNITELKKCVENGPDVHPGANYMITESGNRRRINKETKEYILENLKPGDILERHLRDGDMVLFNRQPSLHRMSMMAHEVRVLPYKTFRLNSCVCPAYNADFDGDEMNMHVFQTDESRAEAKSLMRVQEHILSPRFGGPIIGAIHDHISGAYLLTRKSMKFTEEQALQIIRKSHLAIPENDGEKWLLKAESHETPEVESEIAKKTKNVRGTKEDKLTYLNTLDLTEDEKAKRLKANKWNDEEKEIIKSIAHDRIAKEIRQKYEDQSAVDNTESIIEKANGEEWTGKELFSLLLPNQMNLTYKAEICTKCGQCDKILRETPKDEIDYDTLCPIDAYVVIENGILKHGVIDEKAYGSMSGQILDKIVKEYGPGRAKEFLDRSTDLAICGIMQTGITTSLNDFELPDEVQLEINQHLKDSEEKVDKLIKKYKMGYLKAIQGRSLEETLKMRIMQILGEARDKSGEIAEDFLTMEHNQSVVMARTGARASMLNLTQITSCVGQQAVRGGRIHRGYIERTLPHFKRNELGAKAKGFVHSSYKSGLDPIEFFFHAIGGREGLVDTAIRTAQSGYMQRRLVNALQDLQVKRSGLVIDNYGNVVQRIFGEDGVDPAKSDFGRAANFDKLIDEIRLSEKEEGYNFKDISKPKVINKPTVNQEDINKLNEYIELLKNEMSNLKESEIKSFLNEHSEFKNQLETLYLKYNNLLKEMNSTIIQIIRTKKRLNNGSFILFKMERFDNVNDYPEKVEDLLLEIDIKINEIKKSDDYLFIINKTQLLIDKQKLISDIERFIAELNDLKNESNKINVSKSILSDIDKLIHKSNVLIEDLNKEINSYNEFNTVLKNGENSLNNLKSEYISINDKIEQRKNNVMLIEYQILFDEDIITKKEFNELKKELKNN